jgi:tetratricopeptide (TPR) repeat protein
MSNNHYAAKSFERGYAAYQHDDWDTALKELTRAIDRDPIYAEAYYIRGCVYQETHQHQKAIDDFTRVIQQERDVAHVYFNRARCYDALGQYEEALADCMRALKLDASAAEVYFLRGTIYYVMNQYNEALDDFDQTIKLAPDAVMPYFFRGKVYQAIEHLDEALEDFKVVIHRAPDQDTAYVERAKVYFSMRRDQPCLHDLQRAIQLNPHNPEPHHILGLLFHRNGDAPQALTCYDQAAELGDDLAAEHAAHLRETMLNMINDDTADSITHTELLLPSGESDIVPAHIVEQQRAFVTAFIGMSIQYNQSMHHLEQNLATQKQVAQSERNAAQQRTNKILGQVQDIQNKIQERAKEIAPGNQIVAQPDIGSEHTVSQEDVDRVMQNARKNLEILEKMNTSLEGMTGIVILVVAAIIAFMAYRVTGNILVTLVAFAVPGFAMSFAIEGRKKEDVRSQAHTILKDLANAEYWAKQHVDTAATTYQNRLNEIERYHQQQQSERKTALGRQVGEWYAKTDTFIQQSNYLSPAWSDPLWQDWSPAVTPAPILRLGSFHPSLFENFPVPIYIDFPGDRSLLFKATGAIKATAIASIQSIILRLLATIPPGQVRFTFIDPVGLGQNVAAFMSLADQNAALVSGKAWSEPRHIEQQLANLTEHMENVIQKYLRNQFPTIQEYNAQAGEIAEPYEVLVILDFPVNFQEEAMRRLVSIAQNGLRCGVFTIVLADLDKPRHGFNLAELERVSTVVSWHTKQESFVIPDDEYEYINLKLEALPDTALVNRILKQVGAASIAASKVEVPFERIAPPSDTWWHPEAHVLDSLVVPIGPSGARTVQDFTLGSGTAHHALVVGQPGSGKSTLLHILITGIALKYSPEEVELYLLDFKKGVEFKTYANYQLPHARVIAIESEREFGLSVLEGLYREYERRGDLFREIAVNSLTAYRKQTGQALPRIVLLVDEFHKFFIEQDMLANRAYQLLELLVREGRSAGIHVLLASQTLTGAASLPDSIKGSIGVRIALQCSEADSRLILSDDNPAARLLSRPGEAIYNAKNGLEEGNSRFQVAWLSDEQRDQYLQKIQRLAQDKSYSKPQIVFEGNQPADIRKNIALKTALEAPAPASAPRSLLAWLGEPVAIKDSVAATFKRQSGTNMLIVGSDEQSALGMITTAIISLAAQLPRKPVSGAQMFSILDFTTDEHENYFRDLADAVPYTFAVGRRRQMPGMMNVLAKEVQRRLDANETGAPPIFFIIHGLHRARDLRQDMAGMSSLPGTPGSIGTDLKALDNEVAAETENLGLSNSFGSMFGGTTTTTSAPANPTQQLPLILRDGPEVGVYTIIWCDTMKNLNRTFDRYALREFVLRVAFQMSDSDSHHLVESSAANKLGEHRALLYNDEAGSLEKFRPYAPPDQQWLTQAVRSLTERNIG